MCQRFIKVADMATHACVGAPTSEFEVNGAAERTALPRIGTRVPDAASGASNNASNAATNDRSRSLECAYCCTAGFKDASSVERHVASECRIAQSFSLSQSHSNQRDESDTLQAPVSEVLSSSAPIEPSAVRELLQGRLRRKDDAARLVRTRFPPISNNSNKQSSSDASNRPAGAATKHVTKKSAASAADTNSTGRTRAPIAKKASEPARTAMGDAAGNPLNVCSAACVLSAPVAPAKRQPRGRLAPS